MDYTKCWELSSTFIKQHSAVEKGSEKVKYIRALYDWNGEKVWQTGTNTCVHCVRRQEQEASQHGQNTSWLPRQKPFTWPWQNPWHTYIQHFINCLSSSFGGWRVLITVVSGYWGFSYTFRLYCRCKHNLESGVKALHPPGVNNLPTLSVCQLPAYRICHTSQ